MTTIQELYWNALSAYATYALDGNRGNAGDIDTLIGGADELYGDAGNDKLSGDDGDDYLGGGSGSDWPGEVQARCKGNDPVLTNVDIGSMPLNAGAAFPDGLMASIYQYRQGIVVDHAGAIDKTDSDWLKVSVPTRGHNLRRHQHAA
jgi:Ca2+-binding RTX toxin-like protein